jgi:DNA-binding NarL/FixJ family response regulator
VEESAARMPPHRVLLVEDDAPTRQRLTGAIRANPKLELVAAAGSCAEARAWLERSAPDVLLTDLGLPDGNGIELIRELRQRHPSSLAMVITVFGDEGSVLSAIEAGASGYLLKDGTVEYVGSSLLELVAGGSPISPSIARHLLRRFRPPEQPSTPIQAPAADAPHLTARETEVLQLIAKGFSFGEIAELLAISPHTVTAHVRSIYRKLEVSSRGAAVFEAANLGLLKLGE